MLFFKKAAFFFKSGSAALASATEKIAQLPESVLNIMAEPFADATETTGNALQDVLRRAGRTSKAVPLAGDLLNVFFAWAGSMIAGTGNLVGAVIKAATGIAGSTSGGLLKVSGGILSFHFPLIQQGLTDLGAGISGGAISVLGTFAALILRLLPFLSQYRSLRTEEKRKLSLVFRNSLSLYNIRIQFSGSNRHSPFVLNNTIYCPDQNLDLHFPTLLHECIHIWQYQNLGSRYIGDALGAQFFYGRRGCAGDAYDWTEEIRNRGKTHWEQFNKEAAAQLAEEIWTEGSAFTDGCFVKGAGVFYEKLGHETSKNRAPGIFQGKFISSRDGRDHTALAVVYVSALRGVRNFRLSGWILPHPREASATV